MSRSIPCLCLRSRSSGHGSGIGDFRAGSANKNKVRARIGAHILLSSAMVDPTHLLAPCALILATAAFNIAQQVITNFPELSS